MRFFHFLQEKYHTFLRSFFEGPSWLWHNGGGRKSTEEKYISPSFMLLIWCRGVLLRFFTFQGWMLFWVFLAAAFYSSIMIRSSVTVLFLLLGGLFLFNGLFLLLFFPRLKIRRTVPKRVMQGKEFTIHYELENSSFFPCFSVLADPLLQGKGIRGSALKAFFIAGRGRIACSRTFVLEKRGVWQLPAATVETSFPFGLLKRSFCDHRKVEIFVHPYWQKFHFSSFAEKGSAGTSSGKNTGKITGNRGLDIARCREYVYGDEVRLIHWGNSAKWGKLAVKEFEEEKNTRLAVILDTAEPFTWKTFRKIAGNFLHFQSFEMEEIRGKRFEALLSFAASLSGTLSPEEYEMDFYIPCVENRKNQKKSIKDLFEKWIAGRTPSHKVNVIREYKVGKNAMLHTAFLDELTALEKVESTGRFENITEEILQKISENNSSVLLILLSCDSAAEELYGKISECTENCRVLFLPEGEKIVDKGEKSGILSRKAEQLSSGDLLSGRWW